MHSQRLSAAVLAALGLLLLTAAFLTPGEPRLVPIGLPSGDHVTALAAGDGDSLLAAAQAGQIWRYRDGLWTRERVDPEDRVITVLIGEPRHHPVGTARGLWWQAGVPLAAAPRVLDLLELDDGLVLAGDDGVRVLAEGHWHAPMTGSFAYRLQAQTRDGQRYLHVGTIGEGIYSVAAAQRLEPWQPNSRGLPEGVKVLSFAVTAGGRLLAGTDQGLYWQDGPGQDWQPLGADLADQRILALHRAAADEADVQRLWIGTDDGLLAVDLAEYRDNLEARATARTVAPIDEGVGIGSIVARVGHLAIGAGTVYELRDGRSGTWLLMILGGLGLLVVGAWLGLRSPRRPAG